MTQKSAVDMDMGAPYSCPGVWKDGSDIPNSMPPPRNISVAQRIAETFARQYYGLLADRPSAIANFYTDESLLTRNYAAQQPLPMPNQGMTSIGRQQIMETVMSSVGRRGRDQSDLHAEAGKPCVYTNINSVNASELQRDAAKKSGVMAQITGTMYFVQDGTQWRFSRSVFLEPCIRTGEVLYVRNDIVHYTDFTVRMPGVEMQTGMQPPLYPQAPMPVCAQARHPIPCAMPGTAPLEMPGGVRPTPLDLTGAPANGLPPSSVMNGLNVPPSELMSPPTEVTPGLSVVASPSTMPATTPSMSAVATTAFPSPSTVANDVPPAYSTDISDTSNQVPAPSSPDSKSASPTQDMKSPMGAPSSPQNVSPSNAGSSQESTPPPTSVAMSSVAGAQSSSPSNQAETSSPKENAGPPTMSWAAMAANASKGLGAKGTSAKRAPAPQKWGNKASPGSSDPLPTAPASNIPNVTSNADNEENTSPGAAISSPTSTQANTVAGSSGKSQEAAPEKEPVNNVQLWISGLQTEDRSSTKFVPVDAKEVRDVLNKALKDHAPHVTGEVTEVYRKDERKQHALAMLADEGIAKELVHLGKKGFVTLRGLRLFLDLGSYKGGGKWHEDRERKGKGKGKGKKG